MSMAKDGPNASILLIPDMHMPYCHPDIWEFLWAIKRRHSPDRIICLGDEVDHHALSYHEADPDLDSAGPELEKAIRLLKPIYKIFPRVDVLESNHGSLVYRKAKTAGIPRRALRSYRETLEAPINWRWHKDLRVKMSNGQMLYLHHGKSSRPGLLSQKESCSSAQGHYHTKFDCFFWRNSFGIFFDLHCGYLADHDSLAFAYDKCNLEKGIVGAWVIIEGKPLAIPMTLNKNGRWTKKL